MRNGAEPALAALDTAPPAPRPIRVLPAGDAAESATRERLVRRLAADRLRDLRDDGVTLAYVARMYGVDPGDLERLQAELLPR
ncbi:MAG TPA: hypothetical protein VHG91_12240 [Longimicrobium sp.]|nr:hypothetical protein [Longimicrobium sp.]